jgi:hypothetical protein
MERLSTWGNVARGAHNSEGFALAGEDLGDAKVTNLDMIQRPYTNKQNMVYNRQGSCIIKATEIRIIWRFPEAAASSEAKLRKYFPKRPC